MSRSLHYDHNDDATGYLGFAHGNEPCPQCGHRCNLRAGAIKGNAIVNGTAQPAKRQPASYAIRT